MPITIVVRNEDVKSLRRVFDRHAHEPPVVTAMESFKGLTQLRYEKPKGDGSDLETAAKLAGCGSFRTK